MRPIEWIILLVPSVIVPVATHLFVRHYLIAVIIGCFLTPVVSLCAGFAYVRLVAGDNPDGPLERILPVACLFGLPLAVLTAFFVGIPFHLRRIHSPNADVRVGIGSQ